MPKVGKGKGQTTVHKPGDTVYAEFITSVFSTGVATNADSLPTGTVNKNGTDDGAVTVTVTNIDAGRYKATFVIPSTYVAGDEVNLTIAATVSSVAGKGIVWYDRLEAANLGDLQTTVSGIAAVGGILSQIATSRTLTTGTETGTLANAQTLDGVFWNIADSAGTTDVYVEFDLAASGQTASTCTWNGYLVGLVNTMKVYAYNWGGAVWDQVGSITGISGTLVSEFEFELTNSHTGTGGNAGIVRIRFNNTGLTSSTLKTDRILIGYVNVLTPPTNWSSTNIDSSGRVLLQPTQTGVTIPNVTTITTYTGNTPQTGDAFARLGAAGAGLTALGDSRIANLDATVSSRSTYAGGAVASVTGNVGGNVAGSVGSVTGAVGSVTGNVGGNVAGSVGSVTGAVGSVTGNIGGNVAGSVASVTGAVTVDYTKVVTEAYSTKGGTATHAQLLHEINQHLQEMSISGTTMTIKRRDGSTDAETLTLDSSTNPTSITRAT